MGEASTLGAISAFTAGIISFLSPCVLPLIPGYISYIGGQSVADIRERAFFSRATLVAFSLSLFFVLGFSSVFVALGAGATVIGSLMLAYRQELNIVGGIIVIIFGLFLAGLIKPSWMHRDTRYHAEMRGIRPVAAYTLGLAFAFGWTPCIGPILGAILTLSATSGSVNEGTLLLAVYSIGLGVPFIAASLFTHSLIRYTRHIQRHTRSLQIGAGGILVVMGIAMITGYLTVFSTWLLEVLPGLAYIG